MDTIYHILIWGGLLTLVSFMIAIVAYLIDPKTMGASLGADKKYQNRIGAVLTVIIMLALFILIMVYAALYYEQIKPGISFGIALLINYFIFQIFNLADLFILDWLIYIKIKPAFMRPDYLPVADDLVKHVRAFIKGIFIGIFPALISTLIWKFCF